MSLDTIGLRCGLLFVAAPAISCGEPMIEISGQLGRPFELITGDASSVPRVASQLSGCTSVAGGCSTYCADAPHVCAQREADGCAPVVLDTGSPLSVFATPADTPMLGAGCIELRSGAGLAGEGPSPSELEASVARFRFEDAPHIRLPASESSGWEWRIGNESQPMYVAGVLGGNVLNDFAVRLRHAPGQSASVAFYREFPGDEAGLAAQGRAFVGVQYPRQLVGLVAQDRCQVAGLDCELAGLDFDPDDERIIFESTRLVLDACIGPPPCAPYDDAAADECRLSPGGTTPEFGCAAADVGTNAGLNASLVVATGVPGLVLFADSVERMFGTAAELPACADLSSADAVGLRACAQDTAGTFYAPGWPVYGPSLPRIRVRSVALVPGLANASGPSACVRYQRRIDGLGEQCRLFAGEHVPRVPNLSNDEGTTSSGMAMFGETQWNPDQDQPDSGRWLPAVIVPEDAAFVIALRRDAGSRPIQIDGLLGSTLLTETETIVDYTETSPGPGLRITCLNPESGDCLSAPACTQDSTDYNVACCYGLPQSLLRRVVRSTALAPAPRGEEICCPALSQASLQDIQLANTDLCLGADPL